MYQFTEDCRTGIEQIDEEHRTLFELLNEAYSLVTTVYGGDYFDQLKDMIGRLDKYAEQHFYKPVFIHSKRGNTGGNYEKINEFKVLHIVPVEFYEKAKQYLGSEAEDWQKLLDSEVIREYTLDQDGNELLDGSFTAGCSMWLDI